MKAREEDMGPGEESGNAIQSRKETDPDSGAFSGKFLGNQ